MELFLVMTLIFILIVGGLRFYNQVRATRLLSEVEADVLQLRLIVELLVNTQPALKSQSWSLALSQVAVQYPGLYPRSLIYPLGFTYIIGFHAATPREIVIEANTMMRGVKDYHALLSAEGEGGYFLWHFPLNQLNQKTDSDLSPLINALAVYKEAATVPASEGFHAAT